MRILKNRLVLLTSVILASLAPSAFLPLTPWFVGLFEKVAPLQLWGPVALTGFCIVCSMFPIPAVIPILASGFLFGLLEGSLISEIGTTVGACGAFLIARTVARHRMAGRIPATGRLAILDRAVGEQGLKVVLLSRLSPIAPFISLNYVFGLTQVSFRHYVWGTLLGGAPGTVLFVFFGAGLHSLREIVAYNDGQNQDTLVHRLFFWGSLAVTVVVTVWLTWLAHRALRRALPQGPAPGEQELTRRSYRAAEPRLDGRSVLDLFSSDRVFGIIRRWL